MKNIDRDLETYIDLYQLLQNSSGTREANRNFGLKHQNIISSPIALLKQWVEEHRHYLSPPILSESITHLLSVATLVLLIVAFVVGLLSGVALLRYSGSEPVNLLYFLAAVLFLPLVTMVMALLAMMRASRASSALVHISPAYWMEKIFIFFTKSDHQADREIVVNPLIANHIAIRRSQELALAFSVGLFLALIWVITTQDIAFAWSSTLDISPDRFHRFLLAIALPWREFLPQAVPSIELIEQSHYFRLGGDLDAQMIKRASLLGSWWKFLAMTTLVYAILLRFVFVVAAGVGLKSAINRATLLVSGTRELLREIQEPLIESNSSAIESRYEQDVIVDGVEVVSLQSDYASAIGWALSRQTVELKNEQNVLRVGEIYEAGGLHTLDEDQRTIESISGDTLIYVKSWEPPTLDFIDFLADLSGQKSGSISIYLLGAPESDNRPSQANFDIWLREISAFKNQNIRMVRE